MDDLPEKLLAAVVSALRSGAWMQRAAVEADIALSEAEITTLVEAGDDLATSIEELVDLIHDPTAGNLVEAIGAVLDGFGALTAGLSAEAAEAIETLAPE